MKNIFIESEILNMRFLAQGFVQRCRAAALKDDGQIDRDEEKILKKINTATEKFLKDLSKIK